MLFVAGIGLPLTIAAVNPRVAIVDIVPNLSVSRFDAAGVHELGELPVGHFGSLDVKLADINLLLRSLIVGSGIIAHEERTGGNANHIGLIFGIGGIRFA
jgi:hypothetical protein